MFPLVHGSNSLSKQKKGLIYLLMLRFVPEQNTGLVNLFKEKATNDCKVRIALADPTCDAVRWRDEEEQLGGTLPGRILNARPATTRGMPVSYWKVRSGHRSGYSDWIGTDGLLSSEAGWFNICPQGIWAVVPMS